MKIVLASHNAGKQTEFENLFAPLNIELISQTEFDIAEADETANTFVENALIKARHAAIATKLPTLADDSGLVVPALNGEPGIFSARYAGLQANSQDNCELLLKNLENRATREAYFYCCLVFLSHPNDPTPLICEGKWHGKIANSFSGTNGFGYDPIFYIPSENKTAAELPIAKKNKISHRAKAAQLLLSQLREILCRH